MSAFSLDLEPSRMAHLFGCPALHGLQEQRVVVVLAGRGMNAQTVSSWWCLRKLSAKFFSQKVGVP